MNCIVRLENERDHRETELVTREAFWDVYKPGCSEHLVLHNLRKAKGLVRELDFVACDGRRIAGNIVYSKARVIDDRENEHEVLCLGPVCVLPEYQNKGIGSLLIGESLDRARQLGFRGVVLTGNPKYYGRICFGKASAFGIMTAEGEYRDYLLALELQEGGMDGVSGRFYDDHAFHVDQDELAAFEREFPFKERHVTDTQLR